VFHPGRASKGLPSFFGARGDTSTPAATIALGSSGQRPTLAAAGASSRGPNLLSARGETPDTNMVQEQGSTPTPALLASETRTTAPTLREDQSGMPSDIRRWLEHLERIEKMRNTLAATQMMQAVSQMARLQAQDMTSMMGDGDGDDGEAAANRKMDERANGYARETDAMRRAWIDLATQFHAVPPPGECMGARANYDQVIGNTGSMMLEIINAVRSASKDRERALQTLQSMQGQSNDRIDRYAKETDSIVAEICRRYDTPKWFDIRGDIGGDVMSKLGF
jgi:hypothetical protein